MAYLDFSATREPLIPGVVVPKGKPKRMNPMVAAWGRGPEGETCAHCAHLYGKQYANTYWKCDLRANTGGAATDHRVRWPACAKFEARP